MAKFFKWTVEFSVAETWVEDGFDPDDEDALNMLAHRLPYANIGQELRAKVIKRPERNAVARMQGFKSAADRKKREAEWAAGREARRVTQGAKGV